MLDEAFIEFVEKGVEKSAVMFKSPSVFIVRALTKFFALPGVRLGWGISFNQSIIDIIGALREPWSINCFAELAGITVTKDDDYIEKSASWIKTQRTFLIQELKCLKGLTVFETEANFILLKLPAPLIAKIARNRLLKEGGILRDASNFVGLNDQFVRVAIKDEQSNRILLGALKMLLESELTEKKS